MISLPTKGFLAALCLWGTANASFALKHPKPLGHNHTLEDVRPCGGYEPTIAETTVYYVGGEALYIQNEEEEANILIRATMSHNASADWTNLWPVVGLTGEGGFCIPLVPAPEEFKGHHGFIQVIQNGPNGLSYSCAPVMFKGERVQSLTTICSNSSEITAEFVYDPKMPADGAGYPIEPPAGTASTTARVIAAATSSESPPAASHTGAASALRGCGGLTNIIMVAASLGVILGR